MQIKSDVSTDPCALFSLFIYSYIYEYVMANGQSDDMRTQ